MEVMPVDAAQSLSLYAFEPTPATYGKLVSNTEEFADYIDF